MEVFDVIIIGAGPAGISASNYSERLGLNTLLIFEKFGGQINYCNKIHSIPSSPDILSKLLIKRYKKTISNNKYKEDIIINLEKEKNIFIISGKKDNYYSKAVIVSTGAKPKIPKINISDCSFEKYLSFEDYPYSDISKSDQVLIIGGGYMGLEISSNIADRVKKIYIVESKKQLGGNKIRQEGLNKHKNIDFYINSEVKKIENNTVFIEIRKEKIIEKKISKLFYAAGITANIDFLKGNFLNESGEIEVYRNGRPNQINMSKKVAGLFAAGDVVSLPINGFVSFAEGMGIETAKAVYYYLQNEKSS